MANRSLLPLILVLAATPLALPAQHSDTATAGYSAAECPSCAAWNAPRPAVRVHGTTYYVGTQGLAAILLASPDGHILIDAGLPESAAPIAANIEALGFDLADIRLIVTSHAHYDHAGGVAALQRASGARVGASPRSAPVLRRGTTGPDDPQHAIALAFPAVQDVFDIGDGDTLRVGELAVVAHFTPGHTPGGTSWSWRSCEGDECGEIVYADSQTPVSADDFLFTRNATYPEAIADFERGFAVLERLRCDILLTPHPGASGLWERVAKRDAGDADALVDVDACKRYAARSRTQLAERIAREGGR
jgi:metallo-beta-lactamase class B